MTAKSGPGKPTSEAQLRSFLSRFDAKSQKLIRSVRTALRKQFPGANELVYDYGFSLVIGYSPTDRGIDSIVSVSARTTGVAVYFNHGPQLPDPERLLRGSGKQTRFIQLESVSRLTHPDVKALIAAALDLSKISLPPQGQGKLIIKSDSSKKQSRRKSSKPLKVRRAGKSARLA